LECGGSFPKQKLLFDAGGGGDPCVPPASAGKRIV